LLGTKRKEEKESEQELGEIYQKIKNWDIKIILNMLGQQVINSMKEMHKIRGNNSSRVILKNAKNLMILSASPCVSP